MAIVLEGSQQNTLGSTTVTYSYTVPVATNTILVIGIATSTADPPSAITYNTVAMTRLAGDTSGNNGTAIWYLVNPSSGANTVSMTISGDSDGTKRIVTATFSGVHQTTPFGTPATNSGLAGTASTVSVSSASGEVVVDLVHGLGGVTSLTKDASQTLIQAITRTGMSYEAGAASVSMDWTWATSADWEAIGGSLKPVAVALAPQGAMTGVGQ